MATIQWDHSVHYVNDLDLAIKTFAENGLRAFRGGSHKQWGTHIMSFSALKTENWQS